MIPNKITNEQYRPDISKEIMLRCDNCIAYHKEEESLKEGMGETWVSAPCKALRITICNDFYCKSFTIIKKK